MLFQLGLPNEIVIAYGRDEQKALKDTDCAWQDLRVELKAQADGLEIAVTADDTPVRFLALRWSLPLPEDALFLCDAWERSYGEYIKYFLNMNL